MEQIIYSKYSNERNRDLAIRTDIVKDEHGEKYVRKSPMYEESRTHISNLHKWEKILSEKYAGTCISINHGQMQGDAVFFEYLEGESLEHILNQYYYAREYDKIVEILSEFVMLIRNANDQAEFECTDEFNRIFGVYRDFPTGLRCGLISNIDMIVGNIIVVGDKWHVIDYEWTFAFKIPVNFIIYRMLFYYVYASAKRDGLHELGLYQRFGISKAEIEIYSQMEMAFQNYIIKEIVPMRVMYSAISPGTLKIQESFEQFRENRKERQFRVYVDQGDGFQDDTSYICEPSFEAHEFIRYELFFNIPNEVKAVRLVPIVSPYVMRLERLMGFADGSYYPTITGGLRYTDNIYLFTGSTAFFDITNIKSNTSVIYLDIVKQYVPGDILMDIEATHTELVQRNRETMAEIQNVSNLLAHTQANTGVQIADLNHRLYLAEAQVHEIRGSMSYRMAAPLRKMEAFGRRVFFKYPGVKAYIKKIAYFCIKGPKVSAQKLHETRLLKRYMHIFDEMKSMGYQMDDSGRYQSANACPVSFEVFVCVSQLKDYEYRKMIESVLSQNVEAVKLTVLDSGENKEHYYIYKDYACYDKRITYRRVKTPLLRQKLADAICASNADACLVLMQGDILMPDALSLVSEKIADGAEIVYFDECLFEQTIRARVGSKFKPDYSPDFIVSHNYIGTTFVFTKEMYTKVGGMDVQMQESAMYDLLLRMIAKAKTIEHIHALVYFSKDEEHKLFETNAQKDKEAIAAYLNQIGRSAEVCDGTLEAVYHPKYAISSQELVSILIPNKDHIDDLKRCLDSLLLKTSYPNYEIIVIENNSVEEETFAYYEEIVKDDRIQVVYWKDHFNYSGINNHGAQFANGAYILLLNNDVEIINADWLTEMVSYAQRRDVGAVGAKLLYPNDTIQHAGVVVGLGGVAGHAHRFYGKDEPGYTNRIQAVNNFLCCTAACLLMRKEVFDEVGGLDEKYQVAYNDVDLCCRISRAGYYIVYTPFAQLYHHESVSRGLDDTPEKRKRYLGEVHRFQTQWEEYIAYDPFYNPNLTLNYEDFREK